jgi:hypothetical protein
MVAVRLVTGMAQTLLVLLVALVAAAVWEQVAHKLELLVLLIKLLLQVTQLMEMLVA